MRILALLLLPALLVTSRPALGQQLSAACGAPSNRSLDFWLGTWSTTTLRGQPGGESVIELVAGKCAILERFGAPDGSFVGVGLHTFDPANGIWMQYWTDNRGVTLEMKGTVDSSGVMYEWRAPQNGVMRLQRYKLEVGPNGTVLQTGYATADEGKTWTRAWQLTYRRTR